MKQSKDIYSSELYKLDGRKQAWEMELAEYRALKKKSRFCVFGAWCGIIALLISAYTLWLVSTSLAISSIL